MLEYTTHNVIYAKVKVTSFRVRLIQWLGLQTVSDHDKQQMMADHQYLDCVVKTERNH